MWNPFKKEIRSNNVTENEPHIEVETSACSDVASGIGLLHKMASLSGYGALSQSPFFAAINLISSSLASMGWNIKAYDNDIDIPENFYALHLFDNTNVGHFLTVKNMIIDAIIYGDGFAYIHRDGRGNASKIEYLAHGECSIFYNPIESVLLYRVPKKSANYIEPINILHFKMYTEDGVQGRSLLSIAHNTVKLSGSAEKAATDYFKNGMTCQGILSTDVVSLKPNTRKDIINAWNNSQVGTGSGVAVLEAGVKYQPIASSTRESQLLETRLFNVTEVARWFNMSPVLLGDLTKTSYNSLEQSQLQFVLNTLSPWVIMMEEEANTKLISYKDKRTFYIDIAEEDIVRSDKQSQVNYLSTLVDKGIISRNEARKQLGYAPVEGGDELIVAYTDINQNKISGDRQESEEIYKTEEDKNTEDKDE